MCAVVFDIDMGGFYLTRIGSHAVLFGATLDQEEVNNGRCEREMYRMAAQIEAVCTAHGCHRIVRQSGRRNGVPSSRTISYRRDHAAQSHHFRNRTGCIILGSEDPADYPLRDNIYGSGRKTISSLIYAEGVEDLTITGRGTIDGQ